VDHAVHPSFLFNFDGDHKPLAADGDQLILRRSALGELAQIASQRALDLALLAFDFLPQTRELGLGTIIERAVGEDLAAKESEKQGEVCQLPGKLGNSRPSALKEGRWIEGDGAPLICFIRNAQDFAQFCNLECGTADLRLPQ